MRRKVPTGKGENLDLTEENLARLRNSGSRGIPQEKVAEMVRLKKAGKSRRQIAEETGCSVSSVRNYLIQEGLLDTVAGKEETECFALPETLVMAEPVEPQIHKVRYCNRIRGRRRLVPYLDETERYIPH